MRKTLLNNKYCIDIKLLNDTVLYQSLGLFRQDMFVYKETDIILQWDDKAMSVCVRNNKQVKSRYLEVDGTIFYKFKLPVVQIHLHFG